MSRNQLFNLAVALTLIIVIVFTVREAAATSVVTSGREAVTKCHSLPSRHSIHSEYNKTTGILMIRTEDGPTGVDGGLKTLLSAYRTCSR